MDLSPAWSDKNSEQFFFLFFFYLFRTNSSDKIRVIRIQSSSDVNEAAPIPLSPNETQSHRSVPS